MQEHRIKNKKALVLYSGGLDSTYNLFLAREKFLEIKVIFFNYYQKAFSKEYKKVKSICENLKIELIQIDLPFFKNIQSSIISNEQTEYKPYKHSNLTEWVANRNGVFINIASSVAENLAFDYIILGLNKEEAESFPDNSKEFIKHTNKALEYSTLNKVKVLSFSIDMYKVQIVQNLNKLLIKNKLLANIIWSCYNSYDKMCGKCSACVRLKTAISKVEMGAQWANLFLV